MEIRQIESGESRKFYGVFFRSMGFPLPGEDELASHEKTFVPERSLAAFDGGRIVGTTYSHLFELTVPGGARIPTAGVTAVSVITTHRRRGILRDLMRRQHLEARRRGEIAAALFASESVIYGRFGYGIASWLTDLEIDTRHGEFVRSPAEGSRVRFVDPTEADELFPSVYDAYRRGQPGEVDRPESWWAHWQRSRKPDELLVLHEGPEGPDGYARYGVKASWDAGLADHTLNLHELTATNPAASEALWRYAMSVDLVRTVKAGARGAHEPLRWMLANPRALRVTRYGDLLWVRILDVPGALTARRYTTDVDLVLEVADDLLPEVGGRFRFQGGPEGATCDPTDRPADLALSVADLGAVYLGGTPATSLAAVGRIVERTAGTADRLQAAFSSRPAPWTCTWF